MAKYPDLQTIKNAAEDDIYNLWSGLGYYRRANYIFQAKELIHNKFRGEMPDNYDELIKKYEQVDAWRAENGFPASAPR